MVHSLKDNIKILVLFLLYSSVLIRTAIPFSKIFFYPYFFLSLFYTLFLVRINLKMIIDLCSYYKVVLINVIIFLIALINTNSIPKELFKEAINFIVIILIGFIFTVSIKNKIELQKLLLKSFMFTIYFISGLSIAGIVKFVLELKGIELSFLFSENIYSFGTSLIMDYNYYALILLFGVIAIIFNLETSKIKINTKLQQFFLLALSVSILFTASRRAIIVLIISIIIYFIYTILKAYFLNKNITGILNIKRVYVFCILFPLFIFLLFFSMKYTSLSTKQSVINKINLKYSKCQFYSTSIYFKITSIMKNVEFNEIFSDIWNSSHQPSNPRSGWGNGDYELMPELNKLGLNNLPKDAIGVKVDRNSNYFYWGTKAYHSSLVFRKKIISNKRYLFTMYCWVSNDFNGNEVFLSMNNSKSSIKYASYNLEKKETWQKLYIDVFGEETIYDFLYSVSSSNISTLKGHVLFAYPQLDSILIDSKEPKTWSYNNIKETFPLTGDNINIFPIGTKGCRLDKESSLFFENNSSKYAYSYITYGNKFVYKNEFLMSDVYAYVSPEFNGNIVMLMTRNGVINSTYDLSHKGIWQKLSIKVCGNNEQILIYFYFAKYGVTNFNSLTGYVTFAYPTYIISKSENTFSALEFKPKSLYTSSFNTQYCFFNLNWNIDIFKNNNDHKFFYDPNSFSGPRIDHWKYAWSIYINDYNTIEKVFGDGFDYTNKFSNFFFVEKYTYDYPHNSFLSVLLYSGIIGLILYFFLLIKVVYYYWYYRKEYLYLFLCFAITFFFSFFSSNNPFDPVIMGFFMMLPFFIHYIHKKDKSAFAVVTSDEESKDKV